MICDYVHSRPLSFLQAEQKVAMSQHPENDLDMTVPRGQRALEWRGSDGRRGYRVDRLMSQIPILQVRNVVYGYIDDEFDSTTTYPIYQIDSEICRRKTPGPSPLQRSFKPPTKSQCEISRQWLHEQGVPEERIEPAPEPLTYATPKHQAHAPKHRVIETRRERAARLDHAEWLLNFHRWKVNPDEWEAPTRARDPGEFDHKFRGFDPVTEKLRYDP
jgi:hypothetical protein